MANHLREQLLPYYKTELPDEFFKELSRLQGREIKTPKLLEYTKYFEGFNIDAVLAVMRLSPSWKKFLNHFKRSFKVEVRF